MVFVCVCRMQAIWILYPAALSRLFACSLARCTLLQDAALFVRADDATALPNIMSVVMCDETADLLYLLVCLHGRVLQI